jgi:uncharacterized protein
MPSDAMHALYEGDAEKGQRLLALDDDLPVFDAAAFGRIERLRTVLAADASQANAWSDDGFTVLHLAVFGQQEGAVRLLIEHGADVNVRATSETARVPPLGTAAFVRSVALARLLLDAGADVKGQGAGGLTALDTARINGDEELERLLRERGA